MTRRGSGPKPARSSDEIDIVYSETHWKLLSRFRDRAVRIMKGLGTFETLSFVHGSLARGDVDKKSDIDIVIPTNVSTQMVESSLELSGFEPTSREIVQSTPMHSPKARLTLDLEEKAAITIPLVPLRSLEEQFYAYGGSATRADLQQGLRKKGCTKKLTLVEPNAIGHREWSIIGREAEVSQLLGIKQGIVRERVRVLDRRDAIGRTGIFLTLPVPPNMTFERVLRLESATNPALRRTLKTRNQGS